MGLEQQLRNDLIASYFNFMLHAISAILTREHFVRSIKMLFEIILLNVSAKETGYIL